MKVMVSSYPYLGIFCVRNEAKRTGNAWNVDEFRMFFFFKRYAELHLEKAYLLILTSLTFPAPSSKPISEHIWKKINNRQKLNSLDIE